MNNITTNEPTAAAMISNYVVGIGASAGGLEAINELFDNMPDNTGFSFIIVQHLSPDHKSLMAELLAKHTKMQVFEAQEGMLIKPNNIYLIPTGKTIQLKNGRLRLEQKIRDHQPNNAIDVFFESLAKDKADKSIGIILSGTGSDGTKGIQHIKNSGGTVIVQDPTHSQFDGMPNSAISTGYADLILAADMIPEELLEFVKEAPLLRSFNALSNQEEALVQDILEVVYKSTGHDFSSYKRPTINRRMGKRMTEKNITSLFDYYNYLITNRDEVQKLCKEFLLHVTRFFRDEEAFEAIKNNVIPNIMAKKDKSDIIKVWTVACSTGEEAYSLAMLFEEFLEEHKILDKEVKIFATDISQEVIDFASKGIYSEDRVKGVSQDRMKRFFVKEQNGYKVTASIRKMIVFAKHDILKDPPFSKIDLLTCRNMLIYMNPLLQKNILQKFHFSINDDGYLFLGASENLGMLKDVMWEIDKKWKIYKCTTKAKSPYLESFSNPSEIVSPVPFATAKAKNALNSLSDIFSEALMEEYNYAGIFIDKEFEVKQAIGHFKRFLDFPETSFNFNLLKLVPTDLSIALSTGIRKAIKGNERVVQRNIRLTNGKMEKAVTAIIKPYLVQKTYMQPFIFIVLKEEDVVAKKTELPIITGDIYTSEKIKELESELVDTKENLQALIEEVESANEELQSSNEEIISSNEELQSTNEELQSLNEELHTVNAEHQSKIKELLELNDDLNNYFSNTDIGQILLDDRLIIRKFSPAVTKQVNLIPGDVGRSIVDISTNMRYNNFINDIKSVMQTGRLLEKEIPMDNKKTYLMRIAPYVRQNKMVDGVVVTFVDVSEIKNLNSILEAVFESSASGIAALKATRDDSGVVNDLIFISANNTAEKMLRTHDSLVNQSLKHIDGLNGAKYFTAYCHVLDTGITGSFEFFNNKTNQWYEIVAVKMQDGLVITFSDITARKTNSEKIEKGYEALKAAANEIKETNYKLEQSNFDLLQFASVASHDLKEPLRKIQVFGNLLQDATKQKLTAAETNYLGKMISSSSRMQTLIDNILILSRLSNNTTPYSAVNLNEVIKLIKEDLEVSIKDKGAAIIVEDLPTVNGIAGQIHQLFQNLISNALKFNNGQPVIKISQGECPPALEHEFKIKSADFYCIDIKDNGIGFDAKFSDKIFGIFQRLEQTNYDGTGIGLAIVKKIIDNHNGFIKATSEPGKGACFMVFLPKVNVQLKAA